MHPQDLLPRFLRDYPFQPATGVWRAVEIAAVINNGLPTGHGLDVGCGDGLLTAIIAEHLPGRTWTGIDPDPAEIELALQTKTYDQCIVTGGADIPFSDDSFDFALSNSVLEHIPDIQPVLNTVSRVLKSGGKFIFTVPSDTFHSALKGPLLPWISQGKYLSQIDRRCAHLRYWGEKEWEEALNNANLKIINATPYLNKHQVQLWETASRFTAGVLYSLSGGKTQPINIQRRWGLRQAGQRMPTVFVKTLTRFLSKRITASDIAPYGCLLIEATKD